MLSDQSYALGFSSTIVYSDLENSEKGEATQDLTKGIAFSATFLKAA
jgi:hypothetical protein